MRYTRKFSKNFKFDNFTCRTIFEQFFFKILLWQTNEIREETSISYDSVKNVMIGFEAGHRTVYVSETLDLNGTRTQDIPTGNGVLHNSEPRIQFTIGVTISASVLNTYHTVAN